VTCSSRLPVNVISRQRATWGRQGERSDSRWSGVVTLSWMSKARGAERAIQRLACFCDEITARGDESSRMMVCHICGHVVTTAFHNWQTWSKVSGASALRAAQTRKTSTSSSAGRAAMEGGSECEVVDGGRGVVVAIMAMRVGGKVVVGVQL
jgi:hypothetical protein